ncbi:putative RNA-binding protein L7Ae [Crepidotus variabilis]|uniref:H/ACA ribonucleoprotein complex subunit 2 n=1 Tax=Crepidotus variabilis TaxID=179855 RepID=A0A9P6JW96_9AGAR|nr:putative RNA-binding protein L7Ae [Crepidotus variabilis]
MGKDKSEKKRKEVEVTEDVEMGDGTEKALLVQSAKKAKKEKEKEKEEIVIPLEDLSPIAHPLAQKKLAKKIHKTIKKASKARQVKRGVKEVVKGIRKGEKGLLVLAADINPIDIISHLPVLSEEAQIPYVFVTSKEELGHASSTKRPTSCVMICPNQKRKTKKKEGEEESKDDDYREMYDECYKEVEKLDTKVVF